MPSLGKDLASLRKKQDLSIKDVQETTKLSPAILKSIEDHSIFENTDSSSATYTRSYVRSYAKAIGIEEQKIIQALNEVETGDYSGSLLGKESKEPADTKTTEDETEENDQLEWIEEPAEVMEENEASEKTEKTEAGGRSDETIFSMPKRPSSDDWDWVQVGYQASTESSGPSGKMGLWAVIIVVIVFILGFWLYYSYSDDSSSEGGSPEINNTEEPRASSDSLRQALIENSRQNAAMNDASTTSSGSLPDTLTIGIIAAGDELKPVRVYTDILGKRNPYWVAQGDTIHLNFVDSVRIYAVNQYDRLELVFNKQPIQNFYDQYYNSEQDLLEIGRADFESKPERRRPS
jgi:cytoskeletal protein RodZ